MTIAELDQVAAVVEDPIQYTERFLWIRDKVGQLIPFVLNSLQRKLVARKAEALANGKPPRFLILKSRRGGVTTLEQALNFHRVATMRHQNVVTLAHDSESTEKIFRISNLFYHEMDPALRPRRLTDSNKRDLNFPHPLNSLFYVGTAGARAFSRGDTLQRVHGSEVAWWPGRLEDQRAFLAGLTEACSHGEIVLETTANGVGEIFYEKWSGAMAGANDWTPLFFAWWDDETNRVILTRDQAHAIEASYTDEERDLVRRANLTPGRIAWRRAKQREHKDLFRQEYPEDPDTAFIVSGSSYFDRLILRRLQERCGDPLEIRRDGEIEIYSAPRSGRIYCAGADVSEGIAGQDKSVCAILDYENLEQVAVARGYWRPEDFAEVCASLCSEYNGAYLAVERNNHGHSTLNTLQNVLHYSALYEHEDYDATAGAGSRVLGWPTTAKTRPIMLSELRAAIEAGQIAVHDREFLRECMLFEKSRTGKIEAREGHHDDSVFAWAIALQARKTYSIPSVGWL